jgi:hypothetical protein
MEKMPPLTLSLKNKFLVNKLEVLALSGNMALVRVWMSASERKAAQFIHINSKLASISNPPIVPLIANHLI